MIRVLSLGAGVQSTALALMAANEELPMPTCAIFADTGWEPRSVYRHLDWLESVVPFPVYRVSGGDIKATIGHERYDDIPWYVEGGMGRRQCTKVFKLYPIRRKVRELLGDRTPENGCEMWIGISTNEVHRLKESTVAYIRNRWPLIELRLSRGDCIAKLARWGVEAPRSACCGCPYLSDADWRRRAQEPEWQDTVAISHRLAATGQYMHRSMKPMDQVDFSRWQDRDQLSLFGEECEGICGV